MKISGFEKLTLLDFPGKMAAMIFTQGCNFKCGFCQNSGLICHNNESIISEDEIFKYLEKRKNILDGLVISGGEPTIQKDLVMFIRKVKDKGFLVKLDTNGSNPKILKELLDESLLDYVAMDIKNDFENYSKVIGINDYNLSNIKESIKILKESKIDHEFRTTVIKNYHDYEKLENICKLVEGSKYYLQNFQDSDTVLDKKLVSYSKEELKIIYENLKKKYPNVRVRGL